MARLWDPVPAVLDGAFITDDAGSLIITENNQAIQWKAGWVAVPAEVDAVD
jgi:hypothetical protein